MKTLPIKKFENIKVLVLSSERSVFSIEQLARLTSTNNATAKAYVYQLVNAGLATRLQRGKITFSSDDLVNASQMMEPAYISVWSALYYHHVVNQAPAKTFCVTPIRTLNVDDLGFYYHKIPNALFYGFETIRENNTFFNMATKEKAVIDMVYLNIISPAEIREITKYTSKIKMRALIARYQGHGSKRLRDALLHADI